MRQITRAAVDAFVLRNPFKRSNTEVKLEFWNTFNTNISQKISMLYLHGNLIAKNLPNRDIWITNAGYFTNITKERLNALPYVNIEQKNFTWYLNGKEWDGEWVNSRLYHNC